MSQITYQLFGLKLVSAYPFASRLDSITNSPASIARLSTLYFTCSQSPPFPVDWKAAKLIYSYHYQPAEGDLWDRLYDFGSYALWQFAWGADFYISNEKIDCHLRNPARQPLVELYLTGPVLAFWLERQGFPALHASAVAIGEQVVAFQSHSGHGKSTLAGAFLQAGASLFTDDILPIEHRLGVFWGRPGLPQINLWPDQAAHFMDDGENVERVLPNLPKRRVPVETIKQGQFCHESQPLACIYLPRKSDQPSRSTAIEIIPVAPAEAVIELVRYSFIPPFLAEKMGWQARRLDFFARLVKQVPVRRLHYPAGFEYLPQVTQAVLQDLKRLPPQP